MAQVFGGRCGTAWVIEPEEGEPFLLYESSQAFLDGDPRGIRARFQFRRDVLDYIAMAFVVVGALLLMVKVMQLMRGVGEGEEDLMEAVSAMGLAAFLIVGGAYYAANPARHSAAAARQRMIAEGQVLAGGVADSPHGAESDHRSRLG